jgi:outer membrane protein assembly factor BamB
MLRPLATADGKLGDAKKVVKPKNDWDSFHKPKCTRLPDDGRTEYEDMREQGTTHDVGKKLALYVEGYVAVPGGGRILGAQREQGTHVTTLVALDDHDNERWRIVPSSNPLGADGTPRHLTAGPAHVCADWSDSSGERIGCFALADGKKLWEMPAVSFLDGLAMAGNSLILVANDGVGVYDAETGKLRWKTFDD